MLMRGVKKNPGYMKENFVICIESLHIGDQGDQENVRTGLKRSNMHVKVTKCFIVIVLIGVKGFNVNFVLDF